MNCRVPQIGCRSASAPVCQPHEPGLAQAAERSSLELQASFPAVFVTTAEFGEGELVVLRS